MAKKSVYLISFYTENTLRYNIAGFFLLNFSYSCPNKQVPFTTYTVYILYMHLHSIQCTQCFKYPIFRLMHVKLSKE